ncbi:MAG: type pilus assembly protein PilX [Ramlibacter sp.]|nr:type pilus assembly protein PilX [Ramlibacter sp.]
MNRPHFLRRLRASRRAQRGISLLFSLMALVILGFGAVALTRSVDTGTLIMGNLAMKQDTLSASSAGSEQAIGWLQTNASGTTLDANNSARGYYASSIDKLDPTGNRSSAANKLALVNWDGDCNGAATGSYDTCDTLPYTGSNINGNKVQWVITRLCAQANAPPSGANLCVRPATTATSTALDRGELNPGGRISAGIAGPYYRVIVRIEGPRNTVSYTESLVHF